MKKRVSLLCVVLTAALFVHATGNATFNWALVNTGLASSADVSTDVATDANGNIFYACAIRKPSSFNGVLTTGMATSTSTIWDNSLVVTKLSPAKATLWTIHSTDGVVTPTSITTTPSGDVIVAATMKGKVGTASIPSTNTANIVDANGTITSFADLDLAALQSFVAKFDANGVLQWVKEYNSVDAKNKNITVTALAADANGNVYFTANYVLTVILPGTTPITLTSTNTTQATVIAKLNGATGDVAWAKTSTGGVKSEALTSLAYGYDGNVYASGVYTNVPAPATPVTLTLGGISFTPTTGYDLALIKVDTVGNIAYVQTRPNAYTTLVKDITVNAGKAFVAGYFIGKGKGIVMAEGDTLRSSYNQKNGCVLAFNTSDGSNSWQKAVIAPQGEIDGVTIGNDGNLFAFGAHYNKYSTIIDTINFGGGYKFTNVNNYSGDLFLSSYNVSNGDIQEAHLVGAGTSIEQAVGIASFGSNLYLCGNYESKPVTFENSAQFTTSGSTDQYLISYTVDNPITGISNNKTAKSPIAYVNNANRQLVLTNAENIKSVTLYDTAGRSLKTATGNITREISTQGIASGVYIVKLTTVNGAVKSQRIAIQ